MFFIIFVRMGGKNRNTEKRREYVRELVAEYYQPGDQRRSKVQAYRNVVNKIYPMSERTFWRCMRIPDEQNNNQLKLF